MLRLAFNKPGFLTFKCASGLLTSEMELNAVFGRAWALSLGPIEGQSPRERIEQLWKMIPGVPIARVHVWPVDPLPVGDYDFEPTLTPEALELHRLVISACPQPGSLAPDAGDPWACGRKGEWVLDCVLLEPDRWWLGIHRVRDFVSQWPGGLIPLKLPAGAVSRAWLKMEEALRWSQLPIRPGARWVELGCAPGGSSQALLERQQQVLGVDPAEVDPRILAQPGFTHLRRRISGVPRRLLRKVRWLAADMNVAPNYTLQVVESIVQHRLVSIRGMLLTLKLLDWSQAERVDEYLERVRSWGYNQVKARQLQFNRQEFCVAALQRPFRRKPIPDLARARRFKKLIHSPKGKPTEPPGLAPDSEECSSP